MQTFKVATVFSLFVTLSVLQYYKKKMSQEVFAFAVFFTGLFLFFFGKAGISQKTTNSSYVFCMTTTQISCSFVSGNGTVQRNEQTRAQPLSADSRQKNMQPNVRVQMVLQPTQGTNASTTKGCTNKPKNAKQKHDPLCKVASKTDTAHAKITPVLHIEFPEGYMKHRQGRLLVSRPRSSMLAERRGVRPGQLRQSWRQQQRGPRQSDLYSSLPFCRAA